LENSNPVHLRSTKRSLPIALLRARETVMAPLRSMLAQSGINEQKWRVLRVLNELGPSEQTTIAEAACLLLPSLTRIMASMEKDGFIHRETDTQDRRKTIVALQDAGRQLIKDHAAQSNLIMSQIEDSFGQEKIDLLLNLLEELHQGVPAQNRP
jgi:homoprotocatechuate degradation regulator HpaR